MQVVIVTPETTTLDVEADFVALPLISGEIGVLAGHAPTIGRIGLGEMRVRTGDVTNRFYIDGGFVQVVDDVVSVLTGNAMGIDELNADEIRKRLSEAEAMPTDSASQSELRRHAISQANAQLKVLEKA